MPATRSRGFTIPEIVIGLAVSSVLLTVAVPNFTETIRSNRMAGQVNDFVGALATARMESAKQNQRVTVCKSTDGATCSSGGAVDWDDGWIVFVDEDPQAIVNVSDTLLLKHTAVPLGYTLNASAAYQDFISYVPSGRSAGAGGASAGAFALCDPTGLHARRLSVSRTGRISLDEDASLCPGGT